MSADELKQGETYYYIGGTSPEPLQRRYLIPIPWEENAFVFVGDYKKSYTLFGPELKMLFASEADAWNALADDIEKGSTGYATICRERARLCQIRE